jgi:ketosteroid isomerase-like protein
MGARLFAPKVQAARRRSLQMAAPDLDQVIEQSHLALGEFVKGNPEPLKEIYSHRDDVSLANPYGFAVRGWSQVAGTMERAASNYREGKATSFENVATYATPDLACIVEVERYEAKIGGAEDIAQMALRVTSVFRPEDAVWKLVHRHADPLTTAQPPDSVVQK